MDWIHDAMWMLFAAALFAVPLAVATVWRVLSMLRRQRYMEGAYAMRLAEYRRAVDVVAKSS